MANKSVNNDFDSKMGSTFEKYVFNDNDINITTAKELVLDIDSRGIDESVIQLNNTGKAFTSISGGSPFVAVGHLQGQLDINYSPIIVDSVTHIDTLYITSKTTSTIDIREDDGTLITTFSNPNTSPSNTNVGITIDQGRQRVYVGNQDDVQIDIFDTLGTYIESFSVSAAPGIIHFSEDRIFVCIDSDIVEVYDLRGVLLGTVGDAGDTYISVNVNERNETIYVTNESDNTIESYDSKFNKINTSITQTYDKGGIVILPNDNVFVLSMSSADIVTYSADLNLILSVGSAASSGSNSGIYEITTGRIIYPSRDNSSIYDIDTTTDTTTDTINYSIYATASNSPDITNIDSDEWVNLLSIIAIEDGDEADYSHDYTKALAYVDATDSRTYESFANRWNRVLVFMEADSSRSSAILYHRGQR